VLSKKSRSRFRGELTSLLIKRLLFYWRESMTVASNVKQTLASLKGIESQLSAFALNSMEEEAQKAFHEAMVLVGEIKNDIQLRVYQLEREEKEYSSS